METINDIVMMTTVKNEGPHLLEWLAYHRLIGFKKFVVFQNNSSDLTERMCNLLAKHGLIEYYDNAFKPDAVATPYQNRALRRFSNTDIYKNSKWAITLDLDEFLYIKTGDGTIQALLKEVDQFDAIRINWRFFDHNGYKTFSDDLVTSRYTIAASEKTFSTRGAPHKSMLKTYAFERPGIHNPANPKIEDPKYGNGSGMPQGENDVVNFSSIDPGEGKLAQVFHYIIKDAETYLMKCNRGRVRTHLVTIDDNYWNRYSNRGEVEELGIANMADKILAEMKVIDEICDGRMMGMRGRSVRIWKEKIEEIKSEKAGMDLYNILANDIDKAKKYSRD